MQHNSKYQTLIQDTYKSNGNHIYPGLAIAYPLHLSGITNVPLKIICHSDLYTHTKGSYVCLSSHDLHETLGVHVPYQRGTRSHTKHLSIKSG